MEKPDRGNVSNTETYESLIEKLDENLPIRMARALKDALKFQEDLAEVASEIRSLTRKMNEIADILEKGTAKKHLYEDLYVPFMTIHGRLKTVSSSHLVQYSTEETSKRIEEEISGERVMRQYESDRKHLLSLKRRRGKRQ